MSGNSFEKSNRGLKTFVRCGGFVALASVGVYLLMHMVLIPTPPAGDAPLEELRAYVSEAADSLILANGLRNLILAFLLIFAIAAYVWSSEGKGSAQNPWGLLGLLGAVALLTAGVISNTLRTVAFLTVEGVSDQPDQFVVLLNLNSVLDRVLQLFTGLMFAGFSVAGLRSAVMPKWLAGLGLVHVATTIVTTVSIAWVMSGATTPAMLLTGRTILGLLWFLLTGILMMLRPSRSLAPSR